MKKIINGSVVNIKNFDIFELAAYGIALNNQVVNTTMQSIESGSNIEYVSKIIKIYNTVFNALQYPLYAVEHDIKYSMIATFIQKKGIRVSEMWVDNGLFIRIREGDSTAVKFVNRTWCLEKAENTENKSYNIEQFKGCSVYDEFEWTLEAALHDKKLSEFYNVFMPGFIEACKGNADIMKKELVNMLELSAIPERQLLQQNKILDYNLNRQYMLDIFATGSIDLNQSKELWSLTNGKTTVKQETDKMVMYDFDLYSKAISVDAIISNKAALEDSNKLNRCEMIGVRSLFVSLCAFKNVSKSTVFPVYYGLALDGNLAFTINGKLFIGKTSGVTDAVEVSHNTELYAISGNCVYFIKEQDTGNRVKKRVLYSYGLSDKVIRVRKIIFE